MRHRMIDHKFESGGGEIGTVRPGRERTYCVASKANWYRKESGAGNRMSRSCARTLSKSECYPCAFQTMSRNPYLLEILKELYRTTLRNSLTVFYRVEVGFFTLAEFDSGCAMKILSWLNSMEWVVFSC